MGAEGCAARGRRYTKVLPLPPWLDMTRPAVEVAKTEAQTSGCSTTAEEMGERLGGCDGVAEFLCFPVRWLCAVLEEGVEVEDRSVKVGREPAES